MLSPVIALAAFLTVVPFLVAAFFPRNVLAGQSRLPGWLQVVCPALLTVPYVLVAVADRLFRWRWFALYALLPIAVAALLRQAARVDPEKHANWRDLLVLALLGVAVDLRWFEPAWPARLTIFNKILLLDLGIFGFIGIRQFDGVGFDLRLRLRDAGVGLREALIYTPLALPLGLGLGFLHLHKSWPGLGSIAAAWGFTFFFIAVPEELFFRGWLQNLLERRIGRRPALLLTAALFGLAHFNKRAPLFNWRYVLLAALAGIFYGRAWRQQRRVGASAIAHATVDSIWSLWLR